MRFIDKVKLATHSMINSKSRSILTSIITFIVSTLIICVINFGIVFTSNMNQMYNQYLKRTGDISITTYNTIVNAERFRKTSDLIEKNAADISYIVYQEPKRTTDARQSWVQCDDFIIDYSCIPVGLYNVTEGKNIEPNDKNTNNVLISEDYVNSYFLSTGIHLSPGTVFTTSYSDYNGIIATMELKVKGIFKAIEDTPCSNSNFVIDSSMFFKDTEHTPFIFLRFEIVMNVPKINFNVNNISKKTTNIYNQIVSIYSGYALEGNDQSIYCDALQELKSYRIISIIVIAFVFLLGSVLLLLSVGSLANSIMISVNKNRKFLGLQKALGLNERDLKQTVILESVFVIAIGVALGTCLSIGLSSPLAALAGKMMTTMFDFVSIGYTVTYTLNWYVPLITCLMFIIFAILFARTSLIKIGKMDPIEVINEVN